MTISPLPPPNEDEESEVIDGYVVGDDLDESVDAFQMRWNAFKHEVRVEAHSEVRWWLAACFLAFVIGCFVGSILTKN